MDRFAPDLGPASAWPDLAAIIAMAASSSLAPSFDANNDRRQETGTPDQVHNPGAMSLRAVLRLGDCDQWIEAISGEQLDLSETFDDIFCFKVTYLGGNYTLSSASGGGPVLAHRGPTAAIRGAAGNREPGEEEAS